MHKVHKVHEVGSGDRLPCDGRSVDIVVSGLANNLMV